MSLIPILHYRDIAFNFGDKKRRSATKRPWQASRARNLFCNKWKLFSRKRVSLGITHFRWRDAEVPRLDGPRSTRCINFLRAPIFLFFYHSLLFHYRCRWRSVTVVEGRDDHVKKKYDPTVLVFFFLLMPNLVKIRVTKINLTKFIVYNFINYTYTLLNNMYTFRNIISIYKIKYYIYIYIVYVYKINMGIYIS